MEVSNQNYCQRQSKSFCTMCCGIILVPIIMAIIFWNENDAVTNYATAKLVYDAHQLQGCTSEDSGSGKLVFASCNVYAPDLAPQLPATLSPFLSSFEGSQLGWTVEVYQNSQTSSKSCKKDNSGGEHCVTTYSCSRAWSSVEVDSSDFKCADSYSNLGHGFPSNLKNTGSFIADPYQVVLAKSATKSGGLALDSNLAQQLPSSDLGSKLHPVSPTQQWSRMGGSLQPTMLYKNGNYLASSLNPGIGDIRISLQGRSANAATVAAQLSAGDSHGLLGPYPSQKFGWFGKRTKPLEKLEPGILSINSFVDAWNGEIGAQLWLIRIVCLVVMVIAFEMIVQPLSVAADLLRTLNWCTCCLGSILDNAAQCVIHTVALVMAVCITMFTVAVAWIVARPALGIGLLVLTVAIFCSFFYYQRKKSARNVGISDASAGLVQEAPMQQQFAQPQFSPHQQMAQPLPIVPQQQLMQVTCPAGVGPGGVVAITTPSGQQCQVQVPAGVQTGQVFQVSLPP